MPMSTICPKCGASVPGSASLFCNKCGTRLPGEGPADPLTCRTCGRQNPDRQSQFCDRCGTPLYAAAQPLPAVARHVRKKACPSCGFENSGELLFFCKKCGLSLVDQEIHKEAPEMLHDIPPRGLASGEPLRKKKMGRTGSMPRNSPDDSVEPSARKTFGSSRKIAAGIAAIVVILVVVLLLITNSPGPAGGGPENASAKGLFEMLPFSAMSGEGLFSNQATPVVTDTPPEV